MIDKFMRYALCSGLFAVTLVSAVLVQPALAQGYQYVAVTQAAEAARTGAVRAGTLTWQCTGNRCAISGPWEAPAVSACQALAREVGPIRSYGRPGATLSASEITQCNNGIAGSTPSAAAAVTAARQAARAGASTPVITANRANASVSTVATQLVAETVAPTRLQGNVTLRGGQVWSCQGSRCTRDGRTDVRECFDLARQVGRIRSYVGPGGALRAEDLSICNGPIVSSIQIGVRSGQDDLRQGSKLTASIDARGGLGLSFPLFDRVAQNAYETTNIRFEGNAAAALASALSVRGMEAITLFFRSGPGGPVDGPDNWDMVQLQIRVFMQDLDGGTRTVTLRDDSRTTAIKRFSDRDTMRISVAADALR